jgi:uncharacterized membrane protein
MDMTHDEVPTNRRPLICAGILIGAGMGGFVDGIVFHQMLQLHNMISAVLPPDTLVAAKVNMVWDGIFHALVWLLTATGMAVLWSAGEREDVPWCGVTFFGALFMGWGLFNLIEGVIDHYILGIHHVVERLHLSIYDHLFVLSGVVLSIAGFFLIRGATRAALR